MSCLAHAGDPPNIDLPNLTHQIEEANEVYKPAGVQFFVTKFESYVMPHFAIEDDRAQLSWSQVGAEIRLPFPNLSANQWSDIQSSWFWRRSQAGPGEVRVPL